ncbi:MAG: phosphoadenylyl-sulfate reductase [Rhodospirillales bacterium]|nr:phosphoadenylyl-sulfate reductase [Rhodospirillales bacterium]
MPPLANAETPPRVAEGSPPEPFVRRSDFDQFRDALHSFQEGSWSEDRWTTFRLRFGGIYAQKQAGMYMVRTKIPGGRLSFRQARAIAAANRKFCGGDILITTRQELQLYFVPLDATEGLLDALNQGGVTTRETAGNTFRNTVGCSLAGICPHERVDAGKVAEQLAGMWFRHPLVQHMPRKFKTTISGCAHDCGFASIDDLGFIAIVRDGQPGFKVLAGGGLGSQPRSGVVIKDFVREDEMAAVQEALARVHHRFSDRKKKMASRLKFLIKRFGEEKFVELFEQEFERLRALPRRQWRPLRWRTPDAGDGPPSLPGGRIDQQDGGVAVVVRPPLGLLDSDRFEKLTDIAEGAAAQEFRLTRDQNIIAVGLPPGNAADSFVKQVRELAFVVAERPRGLDDLVSCMGTSTCPIGITNSHAFAAELLADADELADLPAIRVRVSGCPNSCGQHHVGDIGFHGLAKKINGRPAPHYQIHLGGNGRRPGELGFAGPVIPAPHAKTALKLVFKEYGATRRAGESMRQWVQRLGGERIEALLEPVTSGVDRQAADLFVDWGQSEEFSPPLSGLGECAHPVVLGEYLADLARVERFDIDRLLDLGSRDLALRAAGRSILWACRRLLLVAGIEVMADHDEALIPGVRAHYRGDKKLIIALHAVLEATAKAHAGAGIILLNLALDAWIEESDAAVERRLLITVPPMPGIDETAEPIDQAGPGEELARRLQDRHGHLDARQLLAAMIRDEFPGRVAVSSSFGIEAAVLLALVAEIDPATPVIFLDTGLLFEETLAYRDILQSHLGLKDIRTVSPDPSALEAFDPERILSLTATDNCCRLRKMQPLVKAVRGVDAWITGRKRFHGGERSRLAVFEFVDGRIKINPLAAWSPARIEAIFRELKLPRHPLAEKGYTSVGCAPCTSLAGLGEDVRAGRWAGREKTECGIHN